MTEQELNAIEKERKNIYEAISDLQEDQLYIINDIFCNLMSPSFLDIITGVINLLKKDLDNIKECLEKETKEEDKRDWENEWELAKKKLMICNEKLEEREKLNSKEEEEPKDGEKYHLIFAKNIKGKVCIKKDIEKDMEPDTYDTISKLLEFLETGANTGNIQKARKIVNNNKLKDLYEVKDYQTRIIFKKLSGQFAYVELVRTKKDDNASIDVKEIAQRDSAVYSDYMRVKKEIENGNELDIIEENDKIYSELKEILQNKTK